MEEYAAQLKALQDAVIHQRPMQAPLRAHALLSAEQQLAIYAEGYVLRLSLLLQNSFPATRHLLGESVFASEALAMIRQEFSVHRNIDKFALNFAPFLKGREVAGQAKALCELEAACSEVFMRPDCEALTAEHMQGLNEEAFATMPLPLRRSAILLELPYSVNEYLTAFRAGAEEAGISHEPQYVILYRHNWQLVREQLTEKEYCLLACLNNGMSLMQAVEFMQKKEGDEEISAQWLYTSVRKFMEKHYFTVLLRDSSV